MKVELGHAATVSILRISPDYLPAEYACYVLISLHASLLVSLFSPSRFLFRTLYHSPKKILYEYPNTRDKGSNGFDHHQLVRHPTSSQMAGLSQTKEVFSLGSLQLHRLDDAWYVFRPSP
jgi:hypothetical protein